MFAERWMHFDMFLLDRAFQRVSDLVQLHTGRSCFWLAKWAVRAMFTCIAGGVIWIAYDVYRDPAQMPLLVSIVAIAYLMEPQRLFRMSVFLDEHEEDLVRAIESFGSANPYRLTFAMRRFSGVFHSAQTWPLIGFSITFLHEGLPLTISLQLLLSTYTIASYFISCTPKPRGGQRQTKLVLSPT